MTWRHRRHELGHVLTWPRVSALIMGSVFVALSLWVAVAGTVPGDETVRVAMLAGTTPPVQAMLHVADAFGARLTLIALGLAAIAISRTAYRDGVRVAVILILAVATEAAVTWVIDRPRPEGTGTSYPSGHVFGSVVVYGQLAIIISKCIARPLARWLIAGIAVAIIMSVAAARIVLRAHWPSDVAAGLLGGGTYLLVANGCMDTTVPQEIKA